MNLSSRSHVGASEFSMLNWLPIDLRVSQIMTNQIFRILNGKSPDYLQDGIILSSNIHNHSTRSGSKTLFKSRMGTHGQKTFIYQAIITWNSLPLPVQLQQCKDVFKKEVKNHFLKKLKDSEENMYIF
jgi:hypothetical protein